MKNYKYEYEYEYTYQDNYEYQYKSTNVYVHIGRYVLYCYMKICSVSGSPKYVASKSPEERTALSEIPVF